MPNTTKVHVLVFDSGVGGLSIVEAIRSKLPSATLSYLADNAFFPYGLLTTEVITSRVVSLLCKAVKQQQPDIIVIACNTASTVVLAKLRAVIHIPIVGVVPAIKPAVTMSQTKHIGLLATPGTANRDYTDRLIKQFAKDCIVHRIGSNRLVELAEHWREDSLEAALSEVKDIVKAWENLPIDTVVLACTHFPLLKPLFEKAFNNDIKIIDSGDAIARRVAALSHNRPASNKHVSHIAYMTDLKNLNATTINWFNRYGFTDMELFNETVIDG